MDSSQKLRDDRTWHWSNRQHTLMGRQVPCSLPHSDQQCLVCDGGLGICVVCKGGEAELAKMCPGRKLTDEERELVVRGELEWLQP